MRITCFITVLTKLFLSIKSKTATLAAERLELQMASLMIVLVAIGGESLPAMFAGVVLLPCVDPLVLQKACFVLENLPTSNEWTLIGMVNFGNLSERIDQNIRFCLHW